MYVKVDITNSGIQNSEAGSENQTKAISDFYSGFRIPTPEFCFSIKRAAGFSSKRLAAF
jgi:hypothetical protein